AASRRAVAAAERTPPTRSTGRAWAVVTRTTSTPDLRGTRARTLRPTARRAARRTPRVYRPEQRSAEYERQPDPSGGRFGFPGPSQRKARSFAIASDLTA